MNKDLIVVSKPKSIISESIRSLRTNLQFTFVDRKTNVVMVTSSMPNEGKTFISSNLAAAFSMANMKVLLIDCDLRKGRQKSIFKIEDEEGLSNLLLDEIKEFNKYIRKTDIENLFILTKGIISPNPSELLGSNKCQKLFNMLKKSFDLIILDCPPVNCVTDTLVLAPLVDEAIIICSHKKTQTESLVSCKKALENANVKIAGVVMNNTDKRGKDYYYSKYYQ